LVTFDEDHLAHYGTPRKSGRYPWGSGKTPQNPSFLDSLAELRKSGMTDQEIAQGWDISTTQLRALNTIARNERKAAQIAQAEALSKKGVANTTAAAQMGIPESSYRALLDPSVKAKNEILMATANALQRQVDEKTYLDVGSGVESYLGVSPQKLTSALAILQAKGYEVHSVNIQQAGTGLETTMKVLTLPGKTQKDAWMHRYEVKHIEEFSEDGGKTYGKFLPPISINPNRVKVRYKEEGGADADGVIYVRPGVKDVSIGNNRYAQVRIKVGKDHYLKGMAVYKDDLPDGVDLVFNTNKSDTGKKTDAMKKLEADPNLPFGSVISRQIGDKMGTPQAKVTSAMNMIREQGQWITWKKTIASQVLSKQTPKLAKEQLDVTFETRKQEFDDIMRLTNPTVKKKLLDEFAANVDSAAVHLAAAKLPRQGWHVILPLASISPNEVYAPNYRDGERVALIRYPHGGTFEIPDLVVNNRNREGNKVIGKDTQDAIGIHAKVAERLSGADFDGDTVLVVPNDSKRIKTTPALEGLKGFDPKSAYPAYEGMPKLTSDRMQQLMGDVSNLITDMTIKQAPHSDIVRAIRHSMVVIDAEKHNLNYKLSAERNGIKQLKEQYQNTSRGGAATLISRAKSPAYINDRKLRPQSQGGPIDPITGKQVFVDSGKMRTARDGTKVARKTRVAKLEIEDDAHNLSSGTPMEKLYADHSNRLKTLANQARLASANTPSMKRVPSSAKIYADEVKSLDVQLALAKSNSPLERQAQIITANAVRARRLANPNLEKDQLKKIRFEELEKARQRTGASKTRIKLSQKEWDAIQAGAISNAKLEDILRNADLDDIKEKATPRTKYLMTSAKTKRAATMLAFGYTRAEVADALGVSMSTLDLAIGGEG
jgi:hypothetical protein